MSREVTLADTLHIGQYNAIQFPTSSGAPLRSRRILRISTLLVTKHSSTDVGGLHVGEPRLVWNVESNYSPSPGRNYMEVNLDYTDSSGTFSKRFLAFNLERNSPDPDGAWAIIGHSIRLENPGNQEQFTFVSSPADRRRTVFQYAGAQREKLQLGYDGGSLAPEAIEIGPSITTTPAVSISRAQTLADGDTAIVLLWKHGLTLTTRRVEVGPPDGGGPGFRVLRVEN